MIERILGDSDKGGCWAIVVEGIKRRWQCWRVSDIGEVVISGEMLWSNKDNR